MKIKSYFLFLIICIIGCSENRKQLFYDLINDNFLMIVDTAAYKTGRLIQIPNDTSNNLNFNKICILVDTVINNAGELYKSISTSVRSENLPGFEELLLNRRESNLELLEIPLITKSGKYVLVKSRMANEIPCSTIAGKLTFYKPYINHDKAIITFSISQSAKAGYTNCWLFERYNGKWTNVKKIEIEKW